MLQIKRSGNPQASEYHRVIWCAYWPDDEADEEAENYQDCSKMLAVTQEEKVVGSRKLEVVGTIRRWLVGT